MTDLLPTPTAASHPAGSVTVRPCRGPAERPSGVALTGRWSTDPRGDRLRLEGELDLAAVPTLRALFAERPQARCVSVDLGGVTFADIAGLTALRRALVDRPGATVRVVHLTAPVRRVLRLSHQLRLNAASGSAQPDGHR